ncbi:hypothetical protein [Porphyrobacter sp. HT-58-2]|uniref:hypothetical protein n=1 Tax=Porphyrobacter sp. HT-58-2 TaxID=2023229 RepID=UPI001559DAC4|nr:hypothetical protein [Porphyrobacter sp. HT-58-2]
MSEPSPSPEQKQVDRAIALAMDAMRICDEEGYIFAAIDLSSAIDKLRALRDKDSS